jgi:hypothetical protein
LDEEPPPPILRQQTSKAREQCSITGLQKWPSDLTAEDRHLVVKHDDLDGEVVMLGSA